MKKQKRDIIDDGNNFEIDATQLRSLIVTPFVGCEEIFSSRLASQSLLMERILAPAAGRLCLS
jgi:hypothetical protein